MVIFHNKKHPYRSLLRPLCFCGAMTYLVFHALNGNHGVYALLKEQHKQVALQRDMLELKDMRKKQEHRVALLSDGTLDLDLLEERARMILGYAGKDEYIYVPR